MDIQDQDAPEEQAGISPEEFVQFVTTTQNLAGEISEAQLNEISQTALAEYKMDKDSMSDWFEQMERGLDLAKLVKEGKDYPFKGASNVKYPLVTSAALQFNARAYPAIVAPDRVVKSKVWGADPQGTKAARADRVSEFMSWQLSNQVEEWEGETDKLLTILPIVGSMTRKWWFDTSLNRPRCRLVDPGKFIVNNKVKHLTDAPRVTEELPLYPAEIETRIRTGQFVEFEYTADGDDEQGPQQFIEQHTRIDLDEDEYPEPYVVTMHVATQTIVAISADFRPEDVQFQREAQAVTVPAMVQDPMTGAMVQVLTEAQQEVVTGINGINRGSYFITFQFMPSMDGSFHGTGLGILLGDISDAINTIINMMLDAGHYATLGGGWIGSDMRLKGGSQRFRPGEWKTVGSTGGDIKNAFVPMTFPKPDATMFQMLGMLIDAGREIASVKDVITGESKPNQTATATLALIEQGMMVFTAAYKRIFRSLKSEYKLIAGMNAETVDAETYNLFHDTMSQQQQPDQMGHNGGPQLDPAQDYDLSDMDIQPVADPQTVTKMQQAAKAQLVMQLAEQGLVDRGEAMKRIAEAMDIQDVEELVAKPDPMQQQMAMLGLESAKADLSTKVAEIQLTMAKVESERAGAIRDIAAAQSDAMRAENEQKKTRLDAIMKVLEEDRARLESVLRPNGGMATAPRDGSHARGNGNGSGPAAGSGIGSLLGGQQPAGGPAGLIERGAMGGGLL